MGEFNRLIPIDDPAVEQDEEGNDVSQLEFLSGDPDDLVVRNTNGKYYFHDATAAFLIGPYETEKEARDAENRYFTEILVAQQEL